MLIVVDLYVPFYPWEVLGTVFDNDKQNNGIPDEVEGLWEQLGLPYSNCE